MSNENKTKAARSLQPKKTRTTTTPYYKDGLSKPLVGKLWNEDLDINIEVVEVNRPSERERRLKFNFRMSARVVVLTLLAGILGYAMVRNDRALIKDVLNGLQGQGHVRSVSAAESPPHQQLR